MKRNSLQAKGNLYHFAKTVFLYGAAILAMQILIKTEENAEALTHYAPFIED